MRAASEHPILPALKPAEWPASDYALSRALLPNSPLPHMPWVGYGYSHENSFEFLSRDAIPPGKLSEQVEMIEQAALRNLRQRPVAWKIIPARLGWLHRIRMLLCSDDALAAERILDPQSMRHAQEMLRATELAVAVPLRGILIAINARQPRKSLRLFFEMAAGQYASDPKAAITPLVFTVQNGHIRGLAAGQEETLAGIGNPLPGDPNGIYLNLVISADRQTGQETLHLLAGGKDFDRLAQELLPTFVQGVQQMLSRPDFSGQARVILIPERTPTVPDLSERMAALEQQLHAEVDAAGLQPAAGRTPLMISLHYGTPGTEPQPGKLPANG